MGKKFFTVDARAILTLGRDSIKDHTTAVIELVKNSYDADAKIVEVDLLTEQRKHGLIRIADDGDGMSEQEVENNWLRIGFSGKRENTTTAALKRRKSGEKGIGRLSADRLGSHLELRTKSNRKRAVGLAIDWTLFETTGKDVNAIEFPTLVNSSPTLPDNSSCGTELRITKLRQQWTKDDVKKLHLELGLLLPPYQDIAQSFQLRFKNDVLPELDGDIQPEFDAKAEIEFDGKLASDGTLNYSLKYRVRKSRTRRIERGKTTWDMIAPPMPNDDKKSGKKQQKCSTGPLRIRLSFFPRKVDLLDGTGLSLTQLRTYLDRNAGIRIYRDHVRVKPYGEPESPEGDWLGLSERRTRNPAGAGRESFTVNASQIVGAVFITRDDNPKLIDSSSREGLIEGDEFRQLRAVVMRCLTHIETRYHMLHVEEQGDSTSKAAKAKAAVSDLRVELSTLKSELVELQSHASGTASRQVIPPIEQIEIVLNRIAGAAKQIDEIASQNTVFRGLASVGIASAVFGHETEISTASAQSSLTLAKLKLRPAKLDTAGALSNLVEAEAAVQQIASWGRFALLRVKKDKRQKQKVPIAKIINGVLTELKNPLEKSDIALTTQLSEISARTFPMDVEAVVINFVTNAYHAVKCKPKGRAIDVRLEQKARQDRSGFEIVVSDSGPGFDRGHAEMIWQPLFSTKVDEKGRSVGTGLGLTIVKSAVEELGGTVEAVRKGPLGGAEFRAWFPEA